MARTSPVASTPAIALTPTLNTLLDRALSSGSNEGALSEPGGTIEP
jgi:hypothetical protein